MKKIFKISLALIAGMLVILGICKANTSKSIPATPITEGIIEYNIPNITSGIMQLSHAHTIFKLMPRDIKEKSIMSFRDIINRPEKSFVYGGVLVRHPSDSTWEFIHDNGIIVVKNTSIAELSTFFQAPETI